MLLNRYRAIVFFFGRLRHKPARVAGFDTGSPKTFPCSSIMSYCTDVGESDHIIVFGSSLPLAELMKIRFQDFPNFGGTPPLFSYSINFVQTITL